MNMLKWKRIFLSSRSSHLFTLGGGGGDSSPVIIEVSEGEGNFRTGVEISKSLGKKPKQTLFQSEMYYYCSYK